MGVTSARRGNVSPLSSHRPRVAKPKGRATTTCPHCGKCIEKSREPDESDIWRESFKLALIRIVQRAANAFAGRVYSLRERTASAEREMQLSATLDEFRRKLRKIRSTRLESFDLPDDVLQSWRDELSAAKAAERDESLKVGRRIHERGRRKALACLVNALSRHLEQSTYIKQLRPSRRLLDGCRNKKASE